MANGISINIGLNGVDPNRYGGWDGALVACEFDAQDMANIAQASGFAANLLLTADATHDRVLAAIRDSAQTLEPGDMLFLSYSGHGGQIPDSNGDEPDGQDETWVLYDREVIDDELFGLWAQFRPGVRILVFSDSCHSGTILRFSEFRSLWAASPAVTPHVETLVTGFRAIPEDVQNEHYQRNRELYLEAEAANQDGNKAAIGASVILISGCQDNQLSGDGPRNGVFTRHLRQVWANGAFQGDYLLFYQQIKMGMPGQQTPNYFKAGASNPAFEAQKPFTL